MRSMKRIISLIISLTMIVSLITITGVSAADGDIIYEDFGTGFGIDYDGKVITSSAEGFTFGASEESYALTSQLKKTDDGKLFDQTYYTASTGASPEVWVDFPDQTKTDDDKFALSFDVKFTTWHNVGNWYGDFFTIGNADGTYISKLQTGMNGATNRIIHNSTDVGASSTDTWYNVMYIVDMAEGSYDFYIDGDYKGSKTFTAETVNRITFDKNNQYQGSTKYIDNIKLVQNLDNNTHTVTFMDGSEVISSQKVIATFDASFPETNPTKEKMVFVGWEAADGTEVTEDMLVNITESATYYAKYRSYLAYKETFDDNFSIDYTSKDIESVLNITATETAYNESYMKETASGLYLPALNKNTQVIPTDLYIDFDPIETGELKISFDMKNDYFMTSGNNAHAYSFFAIGDASMTSTASGSAMRLLTNANGIQDTSYNVLVTKSTSATHSYVIDIDKTAGSYTMSIDGTQVLSGTLGTTGTGAVSRMQFIANGSASYQNLGMYIDNLMIIENPDENVKTVTFMNGDTVYNTQTVAVFGDAVMPEGEPTQSGKTFLGWKTAEGSDVTEDMLNGITEDATYYASFRDLAAYKETFDDSFSIDYTNKEIDSVLNITATETAYNESYMKETASGLYLPALNKNTQVIPTDLYIDFDPIETGELKISFDMKNDYFMTSGNNAHAYSFFAIGDASMTSTASGSAMRLLTNANGIQDTSYNVLVTKSTSATHSYVIDIDKTAGSYTMSIDGTQVLSGTLGTTGTGAISRIQFIANGSNSYQNLGMYIDNLVIIENPDENNRTVTFMDGDTVYNTQTVDVFGNAVMPEGEPSQSGKVFTGWETADGAEFTEDMLLNVTENAIYYAKYRDVLNVTETFSDFILDSGAKIMESKENPILKFSAKESAYGTYGLSYSASNGYLEMVKSDANGHADADVYIDFPAVDSGKLYIAMDINILDASHNNSVFDKRELLSIGTSNSEDYAAKLTRHTYTSNGNYIYNETGDLINTITGNKTYEFVFDFDTDTYTVKVDGVGTGVDYSFSSEYIDRISLLQGEEGNYYNTIWRIDNITIIEDYEAPTPEIPDTIDGELDATGYLEKVLSDGDTVTINGKLKNGIIDATLGSVVMGTTTLTGRITFTADGEVDAAVNDTVKMQTTLTEEFIYGGKNYGKGIMNGFIQKTPITASTTKYTMILTANGNDGTKDYTDVTREVIFDLSGEVLYDGNARFRTIVTGVPEGVTIEATYGTAE